MTSDSNLRLALVSDIHGNSIALDAVIGDVAANGGADEWWVLGDVIALGHDPVGVLEGPTRLPNAAFLYGNTERYVLTGERPYAHMADVAAEPALLPRFQEVERSFAWTRDIVTNAGWLEWIAAVPARLVRTLPDATRLLGVHASPGSDNGPGIDPFISDDDLAALLHGCGADLVVGGHTHAAVDRVVGNIRAVNLGSVSNSKRSDRRASYVMLAADARGFQLEHRTVDDDHRAVLDAIHAFRHPTAHYLAQFQIRID